MASTSTWMGHFHSICPNSSLSASWVTRISRSRRTAAPPILGDFKSRVSAVGPQIGYLFPVGDMQGYLNLKGYKEFDAANRPEGWNVWLTFAISPTAPAAPVRPTSQLVHK